MTSPRTPRLHALLIGVDCYYPRTLPGGAGISSLSGAVADVADVEAFLRARHGLTDETLVRLTATAGSDGRPIEAPERLPTYENMVAAFRAVSAAVQHGDRVYVHYAGHGCRVPTLIPEVKPPGAQDETLAPTNIGDPAARHLRDVELAELLDDLASRGAAVTVVLDSCHSGGMLRDAGDGRPVFREIRADYAARSTESLVVDRREELAELWRGLQGRRGVTSYRDSGWLPEAREFVLLAACRANERAGECLLDGRQRGILTWSLVRAMEGMDEGATYRTLYEQVFARVHGVAETQTPVLEGEGDRVVLGVEEARAPYTALAIRAQGGALLLDVGASQGFSAGMRFHLFAPGARDLRAKRRIGTATLTALGDTESWAAVEGTAAGDVHPGSLAVPCHAGIQLVRRVRLRREGADADGLRLLDLVAKNVTDNGWVEEAPAGEAAEWEVGVRLSGEMEIRDVDGAPVPHLPLGTLRRLGNGRYGAPRRVVLWLAQLAQWRAVRELENTAYDAPLNGTVTIERRVERGGVAAWEPVTRLECAPGDAVMLRAVNRSPYTLNVTAVLLTADWSIRQVHPTSAGARFELLDIGQPQMFPLAVPEGAAPGERVLKVFATRGAPNFRVLQLDPLGEGEPSRPQHRGGSDDPLQALLDAMAAERPATRALSPAPYLNRGWTVVTTPVSVSATRT